MSLDWSYVAGFFDGEGHISIALGCLGTKELSMSQSGESGRSSLLKVQEFLIGQGMRFRVKVAHPKKATKPAYILTTSDCDSMRKFLWRVLPYTIVKKTPVQDTLRFLTLYPGMDGKMASKKTTAIQVLRDKKLGMTNAQIARKYDMNSGTIWKMLRANEKRFPRGISSEGFYGKNRRKRRELCHVLTQLKISNVA